MMVIFMVTPQTKRVHQLARELGLTPQALLSLLATFTRPILAETIMAHLSLEDVAYIRDQVLHHGVAPEAKIDRFGALRGLLARPLSPELGASLLHDVSLNPEPQVLQYVQGSLRDLYFIARQDGASEALRQQVRDACELIPAPGLLSSAPRLL